MGKGLRQPVELFQQLDRMPELDGEYAGQQKDSWRVKIKCSRDASTTSRRRSRRRFSAV
jgi:hypothetical protein